MKFSIFNPQWYGIFITKILKWEIKHQLWKKLSHRNEYPWTDYFGNSTNIKAKNMNLHLLEILMKSEVLILEPMIPLTYTVFKLIMYDINYFICE